MTGHGMSVCERGGCKRKYPYTTENDIGPEDKYLLDLEVRTTPDKAFKKYEKDHVSCRAIVTDWLIELNTELSTSNDTLHMAVNIFDRVVPKIKISKKIELQTIGATCYWISTKFNDNYPPTASELSFYTAGVSSVEDLVRMEARILNALRFNVSSVPVCDILHKTLKRMSASREEAVAAFYFADLSLLHASFIGYTPSIVATAAVLLARTVLGSDHSDVLSGPETPDSKPRLTEVCRMARYLKIVQRFNAYPIPSSIDVDFVKEASILLLAAHHENLWDWNIAGKLSSLRHKYARLLPSEFGITIPSNCQCSCCECSLDFLPDTPSSHQHVVIEVEKSSKTDYGIGERSDYESKCVEPQRSGTFMLFTKSSVSRISPSLDMVGGRKFEKDICAPHLSGQGGVLVKV